jgi:hypothetical protein
MKKLASLFLFAGLLLGNVSCKDKDKDPEPQAPSPVQQGKINFKVTTYDSYGLPENDNSNIKISLAEDNLSALTDANGMASFSNLPYGNHTPVLEKADYDGPMVTVALNAPEYQSLLPFPRHSEYEARNFQANAQAQGAVFVTFTLSAPPADSVRIAVLGSPAPDLSNRKFVAAEIFKVKNIKVTDYEISALPSFKTMLAGLDSGATFYVTVMPVSYGLFQGNLQAGPQLLGENLQYVGNIALKKNWKK